MLSFIYIVLIDQIVNIHVCINCKGLGLGIYIYSLIVFRLECSIYKIEQITLKFPQSSGKWCYNFRFSFYIKDLTNRKALGTYLIVRFKIH